MRETLHPAAETMLNTINTYGCITLAQGAVICGGDEDKARRTLSHLILIHTVHERNGLYVPMKDPKVDNRVIDSIWVALDKSKDEEGNLDLECLNTSFPNHPVDICLIKKEKFFNIVAITNDNISSSLPFLMDKFAKNYKSADQAKNQEYIFVVRDKSVIKEIADFSPNMPNRIALLEGDLLGDVTIRYLSPKKA